jgi:hypothetical protein
MKMRDWIRQVAKAGIEAAVGEIDRQGITGHQREAAIRAIMVATTERRCRYCCANSAGKAMRMRLERRTLMGSSGKIKNGS